MRAQRFLPLCVVAYLLHEARMARLPQMEDPEVTAPMVPDDETKFYFPDGNNEKHPCKKCPAGSYVLEPCKVPRTEGTCQPCEKGTFANDLNSFHSCFSCQVCRALDEVEIKKCTATTDTECACKNGTFCSPSEPCETCHRCMQSCPPGEKKVQDCMPTSDTQCLPDTTPSPPTGSHGLGYLGCLIPLALVLAGLVFWKNARCRNACISFWSPKTTQFLQYLQKSSHQEQREEHDNMLNAQVDQRSRQLWPSGTTASTAACETMPLSTASPPEEEGPEFVEGKNLIPANGKKSADALSRSFDIFIREVPLKEWKRFMRALNLTDNEITSAEMSSRYVNEQSHEMLRTWLDKKGQAASLNVLLKALCGMDLRGVVEKVRSALVAEGLYVYEE